MMMMMMMMICEMYKRKAAPCSFNNNLPPQMWMRLHNSIFLQDDFEDNWGDIDKDNKKMWMRVHNSSKRQCLEDFTSLFRIRSLIRCDGFTWNLMIRIHRRRTRQDFNWIGDDYMITMMITWLRWLLHDYNEWLRWSLTEVTDHRSSLIWTHPEKTGQDFLGVEHVVWSDSEWAGQSLLLRYEDDDDGDQDDNHNDNHNH